MHARFQTGTARMAPCNVINNRRCLFNLRILLQAAEMIGSTLPMMQSVLRVSLNTPCSRDSPCIGQGGSTAVFPMSKLMQLLTYMYMQLRLNLSVLRVNSRALLGV